MHPFLQNCTTHHGFVVLYRRTASSIKAAIALGKPICFGFLIFESFETKEVAQGTEDGLKGPGWMPLPDGFKPDATAKALAGSEGVEEKKDDAGNVIGYVTKDEDGNEVEVTDSMAQCAAISEKCMGGHAVAIVGYDDATETYLIRNSWGEGWGDGGYFHMPYSYLECDQLAFEFWTITEVSDTHVHPPFVTPTPEVQPSDRCC
jgi:hypothetical protein